MAELMTSPHLTVRSRRVLSALGGLALMAGTSACSGPLSPLQVDVHGFASDIVLGNQVQAVLSAPVGTSSVPVPTTPTALPPGFVPAAPQVEAPDSPPVAVPAPPSKPVPCPPDDPLQTPAREAPRAVEKAPVEASYPYRSEGTYTAGETSGTFAKTLTRSVSDVMWDASGESYVEYTVTSELPEAGKTVERYRAVLPNAVGPAGVPPVSVPVPPESPPSPAPSMSPSTVTTPAYVQGGPAVPGLYLLSRAAAGSVSVFNGGSGMVLVQFPVLDGTAFRSTASDGLRTIEYVSRVRTNGRVNACGTPLAAWSLALSGTIAQADAAEGATVSFDSTLSVGPQYGGLVLAERTERRSSGAGGGAVREVFAATINREPEVPA